MQDTISVVIPTYNEKESIGDIISLVLKEVYPLGELIIVDDNSLDKTWQLVENIIQENNKIRLIRRIN